MVLGRAGRRRPAQQRHGAAADRVSGGGGRGAPPTSASPAEQLAASPYFDLDWYNTVTRGARTRPAAARHYVRRQADHRSSPHPLFDAGHMASSLRARSTTDDRGTATSPLELFLRLVADELPRDLSPHPLLDADEYLTEHPSALEHPSGIFGHCVDVGVAARFRPSGWTGDDVPGGDLVGWLRAEGAAWARRQSLRPPMDREPAPQPEVVGTPPPPAGELSAASVVVVDGGGPQEHLLASLRSVARQQDRSFELVVVHHRALADEVGDEVRRAAGSGGYRTARSRGAGAARLRNLGLALASADVVAWLCAGDTWGPGHLGACRARLLAGQSPAVHDVAEVHHDAEPKAPDDPPTRSTRYTSGRLGAEALGHGATVPLSSVVVRRRAALDSGGFDEELPAAVDADWLLRVALRTGVEQVPGVGTHTWSPPEATGPHHGRTRKASLRDLSRLGTWGDVVVNRTVVDWPEVAARARVPGSVSVVIPTHDDVVLTAQAVRRVVETTRDSVREVEVLVVDNGTPLPVAVQLAALPLQHPGADVRVVPLPVNHGFSLGNNFGAAAAKGEVLVLLNNDTEVAEGWLEPLVDALADPEVLGAQSLLMYPSGTIQSAGIAFPTCGGVPHAFLQGFPLQDGVRALPGARFAALTAAAMAVRTADFAGVQGLDPIFRNGMEDVDLGLRLQQRSGGYFVVRPDSRVVHHESKAAGRYVRSLQNRRVFLERWRGLAPRDDVALWALAGFRVSGHAVVHRMASDSGASLPQPRLVRELDVHEPAPCLRWALKSPAPATPEAEMWGDTHFVRALAAALERCGQEVVLDHRPEVNRATGLHDDVALVLRGIAPDFSPVPGQLSLMWLISHPDMLGRSEAEQYDLLLAASNRWARETSRAWGLEVEPLLQATDPSFFHPGSASPDTGHPVLFVGNSRRKRRFLVALAADSGLPLSVYGPGWEGLVPPRLVKGLHVPNERLSAAYRSAGVVLNDHWEDMREAGFVSNRLFDAVASGARVVSDDVGELPSELGRSVQVVHDAEELAELLRRDPDEVFGDDAERRATARRVAEAHSFDARASRLVELAVPRWRHLHQDGAHRGDEVPGRRTT